MLSIKICQPFGEVAYFVLLNLIKNYVHIAQLANNPGNIKKGKGTIP